MSLKSINIKKGEKMMCGFRSKIVCDKDGSFGDIMVMSLRYTFGRHTYAVKEVCDFIKENKVKKLLNQIFQSLFKLIRYGFPVI